VAGTINQFLSPVTDFWRRLTLNQKAGLVVSTTVVLSLLFLLVTWTSKAPFATMYSGLSGKDAARIVDDLRERKIAYRLADGGTRVLVPQNQVYELRLHFAAVGLPGTGDLGYEVFDKPMLGMTEFMQKLNYHRALEGELARTIGKLDEVESARVHLVLPAPTLFTENKKEPTAAVVLQLEPNVQLTQRQIQGISYLIAYAVEGMTTENITIVDASGNLLSGASNRDTAVGLTATQLEVQFALEEALARKAKTLLDGVVGPGKSEVKLAAKLNWDRTEKTVEQFDAERIAIRSEERRELTGEGGIDGGATTEENQVTNYEIPRTVEKINPEVGNVERLWVSVLVDGTYRTTTDAGGNEIREFVDRSPAEMQKISDIVKTAVGFDETRRDRISVVSFPFEKIEEPLATGDPAMRRHFLLRVMEKGILALLLVGIFLLARSLVRRLSQAISSAPAVGGTTPAQIRVGRPTASLPAGVAAGTPLPAGSPSGSGTPAVVFKEKGQGPIEIEEDEVPVDALKRAELQKRATQFIQEKPDLASQLVRSWIVEDTYEPTKK
jgi:flagellar M-ring protein FliF